MYPTTHLAVCCRVFMFSYRDVAKNLCFLFIKDNIIYGKDAEWHVLPTSVGVTVNLQSAGVAN